MTQPNSIALVSAAYPPYSWGGIDTQTYDLAHQVSALGTKVTVFCGGAQKPTITRENNNLTVCRLPVANFPPRVAWFQLQNLRWLSKKLPAFDLVHTQHSSGSIYGMIKGKIGKPWIVSFHDHHLRRLLTFFNFKPWKLSLGDSLYYTSGYLVFDVLTRMELKWADHYIMCGKAGLADYLSFSRIESSKATLIENGIDLGKINSLVKDQKLASEIQHDQQDGFTLFTCGRLVATKGTEYLISAMPQVLKENGDVKLKIFGKGPMEPRLKRLISSLRLKDHVFLEGHVPYPQLIREMHESDLAIFPSMVEVGASIAIMEAMACHKSVIAFRYPFNMDVIEHLKTGFLVPERSTQKLAQAMSLLLQDSGLRKRIGENAFNHIVRNHDYRKIAKKYIEVYSNVASNRGK